MGFVSWIDICTVLVAESWGIYQGLYKIAWEGGYIEELYYRQIKKRS
jgi:hypothetical protein